MSKNKNNGEKSSNIKENNNTDTPNFCDILSIPSTPEDLFTLLYPIGHGAFGSVYKAIHNNTNKLYAIKIIDYSKDNNKENNNMINYNYLSVQEETKLMKLVNKSNYIVKYYGSYFSRKTNTLWLILEYCSSGSAIDLMLSMDRTFSEVEVATIMEMVLQGLVLIHSKNLIHRDIKGANILLSEDGYAKLGDFGVGALLLNQRYRKSKKGSPYWMSPQVAANLKYDFKTDIWSLGITCIELIEGEPPFSELSPKIVMEKISKKPPSVDEIIDFNEHTYEFKSFVEHCLETDPRKRYSAEELLKHEFITKFSKGRKYMINLIKSHVADIEKYRIEAEEEYQKAIKNKNKKNNESLNNEDNSDEEEIYIEKLNCKGTYQENMNEINFDSIDNKMEKFLKKKKNVEQDKKNKDKNDENKNEKEKPNDINNLKKYGKEKIDTEKSVEICYTESIIAPEDKSSISKDKENIIIIDKSIKKKYYNDKENNISLNLKIIKNDELEIYSHNNLLEKQEKNMEEKNILKLSLSSGPLNNAYNSLYSHLTPNATEDNSKRGNNEENIGTNNSLKKENCKSHSPKESCDFDLMNDNDEIKTKRNRKPLTFENNSNDISFINHKNNDKKEENINDSDDDGIINETNDYNNFFKGVEIYQNQSDLKAFNKTNNKEYEKNIGNKNSEILKNIS